ncbi:ATP-binding protein [Streptomyces avermitilis]|uniref:ATP-binding protein n=1 Tax=Streptomyces avermitilis TaxID=33903 RepID=UPI0037F16B3C
MVPAQSPFVGRDPEFTALRAALVRVRRQEPQLALVTGEPGIGKTTLIRRFLHGCEGLRVLYAAGEESELAHPYCVLTQLLDQGSEAVPEGLAVEVDKGGRYADPLTAGAALLDLLGRAAWGSRPVAVVVDDAHWADTPSLHALGFALRRLRVDRVLALVLVRDEDDPRLPGGLRRLFADEGALRLPLGGLDAAQVRELSGALHDGAPLSSWAAARLQRHTGGNPLHVRALLRQTPAAVLAGADALPAPLAHQQVVRTLLAGCPEPTRRLVQAGSVLGASFAVHQAVDVAGEVARPLAALDEAVRAGLLEERTVGGNPHAGFPHPLVRAAVYRDLGAQRRAELHLRAARRADSRAAALDHLACAASGPDHELAGRLAACAEDLAQAGAWAAAAAQLRFAARLSARPAERERRLLMSTEALLLAGDVAQAQALEEELRAVRDCAPRQYVLGRLALATGRQAEASRLLSRAWDLRSLADPPLIAARAAEQLAWLRLIQGDGREAVTWAARCAGTGALTARDVTGLALALSGRPDDALRAVADPGDDALDGLLARGILLLWRGRHRAADEVLARAAARHREGGLPGLGILALAFGAEAAHRGGDWDTAVARADLAVSLAHDTEQRWLLAFTHATAAAVPAARGDGRTAREHACRAAEFAAALGDASDLAYAATARAQEAAAAGDDAAVVAALLPLTGPGIERRDSIDEPGIFPWPALLVEALARTGRADEAAELLGVHEARAARQACGPASAALLRARGALCAVRGERAAAEEAYGRSLELFASYGLPCEEALTRLAYGSRLRRWGKRGAAIAQLEAARGLFARLAAVPYARRCEGELTGCGRVRRAAGADPAASAAAVLTPQELTVSRLAATGLTNREIARELLLSAKTIEHHLGRVYAKLSIRSRAALAATLGE